MLSNAYFLAKFRFDTAENEPAKDLQKFRKMHFSKMHFRKRPEGAGLRREARVDLVEPRPNLGCKYGIQARFLRVNLTLFFTKCSTMFGQIVLKLTRQMLAKCRSTPQIFGQNSADLTKSADVTVKFGKTLPICAKIRLNFCHFCQA